MITSCSCCRFVGCTSMMWISRSTTSQRCCIGLRSGDCGVKWTHCHVQKNSLRWFELCDMLHYPAGSSIRRWYTVVIKGWTWSATILRSAVVFKQCSLGTKRATKISPPPLHHHQHPEPLRQGRMDPCFHVLYAKFWSYHLNVAAEIETFKCGIKSRFYFLKKLLAISSVHHLPDNHTTSI